MILALSALKRANSEADLFKAMEEAAFRAKDKGAEAPFFPAGLLPAEAPTFKYPEDILRVPSSGSPELAMLAGLAAGAGLPLGMGLYLNELGGIYSSYLVIDETGEILALHRGLDPSWKAPFACADYREGPGPVTAKIGEKRLGLLLTGDFKQAAFQLPISELDLSCDAVLCAQDGRSDFEEELAASALLARPVLYADSERPAVFIQGRVAAEARDGLLFYEL